MAKPKWIVMVFMAAEADPNATDLSKEAEVAIKQMEEAVSSQTLKAASDPTLSVFFQLHGQGAPQRGQIREGKTDRFDVEEPQRDATDGKALIAFVKWALGAAPAEPHDHSMLVLWGHAYQFAFGHAVTDGRIDGIDFAELSRVFRRFQDDLQNEYKLDVRPKLDIVGFDSCDLATLEVAYQACPFADYLVASQIGIPLQGWPYKRILDRLSCPKGRLMGPAELGTYIVRRFCEHYQAKDHVVSLTLLDLKLAPTLQELTEELARRLAIAIAGGRDDLDSVRALFFDSQTVPGRPFVDVADLCFSLQRGSSDAAVQDAATTLGNALLSADPVLEGQSATGSGRPFIVEHGRNAAATARLNGVSLYAPHVSEDVLDFEESIPWYDKFDFAQETLWTGDLP
jgi:hypothetical protein